MDALNSTCIHWTFMIICISKRQKRNITVYKLFHMERRWKLTTYLGIMVICDWSLSWHPGEGEWTCTQNQQLWAGEQHQVQDSCWSLFTRQKEFYNFTGKKTPRKLMKLIKGFKKSNHKVCKFQPFVYFPMAWHTGMIYKPVLFTGT